MGKFLKKILVILTCLAVTNLVLLAVLCFNQNKRLEYLGEWTYLIHRQVHKYGELLYVSIASDYDNNTSDIEQVDKALRDGGMIKIKANSNFISNVMPGAQSYGASNSSGSYYIYGAIINYIASRGWTLVSADGQDDLYFVK